MTPVEEMKTSEGLHPKCFASSAAHCRAAFMPASPVTALALPAFTRTARVVLPETFKCSRVTRIGAAGKAFFVKTTAVVAGRSE